MENEYQLSRLVSILYRLATRFFDKELSGTMVGYGQHFFLARIYENPGISMQDLAKLGHFDKGTVTKAIQKMVEQEYIRREADEKDRRIQRLYAAEKSKPMVDAVYQVRDQWNQILTKDLSEEEIAQSKTLLYKMAENAYFQMNNRKVE